MTCMKKQLRNLLALVLIGTAASAWSATITVAPGEAVLNAGNGLCSLREAIMNAESDSDNSGGDCPAGSGADTIVLAAGSTYTLSTVVNTVAGQPTIGLPEVRSVITVNGNGAIIQRDPALFSTTACSGAGAKFRILMVGDIGNLTLNNLTLQNGCPPSGNGGAIYNHGVMLLDGVKVLNNAASAAGGIQNDNTMTLVRSTVANNVATGGAGGGIINTRTLTVLASTISDNSTPGAGGGLVTTASVTLTNSTLSSNSSNGLGGGSVVLGGTVALKQSTVASNNGAQVAAAATPGSGIYRSGGTVTLTGALLAMQVGGSNCGGSVSGTSSAADDSSCTGATFVASPMVGPLADNGGPTRTHALLTGSPLIDAGNNTSASGLTTDQRGLVRIVNASVDFGALEYQGADADGVTDADENAVPNASGSGTGDGNGDSIPDAQQNNVASAPLAGASGGYGTVVSVSGKPLSTVTTTATPAGVPAGYSTPYGAFAFLATGITVGATEVFELYVPYNANIAGALKRNRLTNTWQNVATSVQHIGTTKTKITYSLTDGGPFDADGLANGQIQDPIVPFAIVNSEGIPTLSQWGAILLSGLVLLAGLGAVRRRRGASMFSR